MFYSSDDRRLSIEVEKLKKELAQSKPQTGDDQTAGTPVELTPDNIGDHLGLARAHVKGMMEVSVRLKPCLPVYLRVDGMLLGGDF